MTPITPVIDPQNYATNTDYSNQPKEPKEFWVVYYKGRSGQWFIVLPSLYEENAIMFADSLDRPTKILHYKLNSVTEHQQPKTTKKVKKIAKPPKKIRKVRSVVTDV